MRLHWLASAILSLWAAVALSAPPAEYVCRAVSEPPTLDGKPTEACWQSAATPPVFHALGGNIAGPKTELRVIYDQQNLYVAVQTATGGDAVPAPGRKRQRDGRVWNDPGVELFLQTNPVLAETMQLVLNSGNAIFDEFPAKGGKSWNPEWRHAANAFPGGWSAEMAIPFAALGVATPKKGFVWRVRVGTNTPGQPHTMWPQNRSTSFHNPACWAYLVFGEANLLPNGGFEGALNGKGVPQGWLFHYHDAEGKGKIEVVEKDAPEGKRLVRYEKFRAFQWFPQLWSDRVTIQPHAAYEFSFLVDSPKPFVLRHGFFNDKGQRTAKFSRNEPPTKGYERRSLRFRIEDEEPNIAFGIQYSRMAGVMRIDDARLVRVNQGAEYRNRVLREPHRYHGLERLAARRPFPPLGLRQSERVIFPDSATGAPIWKITDSPGFSTRHYYMEAPPWNRDGSRFVLKRRGLVDFSARGIERETLNDSGGWFVWDREDREVFYFCRNYGKQSSFVSHSLKTGKETVLRRFPGNVGAWCISKDNRYVLCKQMFAEKPLAERTRVILVDLKDGKDRTLDPKGHIHQLWFTKLPDYSFEFEYEHHGGYEAGQYREGNFMMTLDGKIQLIYGGEGVWAGHRAHSPSGEWMCPGGALQIINKLTGEVRSLGTIGGNHQAWETEDSWLAASSGAHLIRFAADGRGFIHRIASHNSRLGHSTYWSEAHPAMSRDGTKLAFASIMLGDIDFYFAVMRPPETPRGVELREGRQGLLTWDAPKNARELSGYRVYQSDASGGPYEPVGFAPAERRSLRFPSVSGKARYLVVTSVEYSGLESLPSAEVCSFATWPGNVRCVVEAETAPVTKPPAMEEFVAAASGMHCLNLGKDGLPDEVAIPFAVPRAGRFDVWLLAQNAENSFVGQARVGNGPETPFAGKPGEWQWLRVCEKQEMAAGAQVLRLRPGTPLTLVDQILVTDGPAPTGGAIRLDATAPPVPKPPVATSAGSFGFPLSWPEVAVPDRSHYNVYVAKGTTCEPTVANLLSSPEGEEYTVWGLEADTPYACVLTAVDHAGNESVPSPVLALRTQAVPSRWLAQTDQVWQTKDGGEYVFEFETPQALDAVLWTKWANRDPKRRGTRGRFQLAIDGKQLKDPGIRFGYVCLGHGGPVVGHTLWDWTAPVYEGRRGYRLPAGKHRLVIKVRDSEDLELGGLVLTNDLGYLPSGGYTSFLPLKP